MTEYRSCLCVTKKVNKSHHQSSNQPTCPTPATTFRSSIGSCICVSYKEKTMWTTCCISFILVVATFINITTAFVVKFQQQQRPQFVSSVTTTTTKASSSSVSFFSLPRNIQSQQQEQQKSLLLLLNAKRYGPSISDDQGDSVSSNKNDVKGNIDNDMMLDDDNENDAHPSVSAPAVVNEEQRIELRKLIDTIRAVQDPQHIPSILTKNIEFILSCITSNGEDGIVLIETVLEDILIEQPDATTASSVLEVIDIIVSFGEEFVNHTAQIQKQNQLLLGKIIKLISATSTNDDNNDDEDNNIIDNNDESREDELDRFIQKEREQFTPGFLRHIDMECDRIRNASTMTKESIKLLETLRIIQRRVLEELCSHDLGEVAQVLGQLIGYESRTERITILNAGLMVRGIEYGKELYQLTTEALNGFQSVVGGADPDLIDRVQDIHEHLQEYIKTNDSDNGIHEFE